MLEGGYTTYRLLRWGSRASRRPSPIKLILSKVIRIISPGMMAIRGAVHLFSCDLLSILPQLAVGG